MVEEGGTRALLRTLPPEACEHKAPENTNSTHNLRSLAGRWQKVSGAGSWFFLPTPCPEMFECAKISRRFGLKRAAGSLHNTVLKGVPHLSAPCDSCRPPYLTTAESTHSHRLPLCNQKSQEREVRWIHRSGNVGLDVTNNFWGHCIILWVFLWLDVVWWSVPE